MASTLSSITRQVGDLDRRIRIVRARISRSHGHAKQVEQYQILSELLLAKAELLISLSESDDELSA